MIWKKCLLKAREKVGEDALENCKEDPCEIYAVDG